MMNYSENSTEMKIHLKKLLPPHHLMEDDLSVVRFEIPDNIENEFHNRKSFIESKRKRLDPMRKLQSFECPCDFEESFGGILNFQKWSASERFVT